MDKGFATIESDRQRRRCKEDYGGEWAHDRKIRGEGFRWELFVYVKDYSNVMNGKRDVAPWMRAQNKFGRRTWSLEGSFY